MHASLSRLRACSGAFLLLAITSHSEAASYYVDYSAGSDANVGTSSGAPWQHCPGDANATGLASGTTLAPGDTVHFKGGVSYVLVGSNITPASGTVGNPVVYDGNSSGTWGTGMAVITDNNSANNLTAFRSAGAMVNVTFNGFRFSNIGGGPLPADPGSAIPAKPGYGIVAQQMTNVFINGCYFGQLGYYQQLAPIGGTSLAGDGVECSACDGLTITNCEFTQTRDPVQLLNQGNICNVTIVGCLFHDQMEWAITALHNTTTFRSNLTICGCVFSNTDQYYVSTNSGGLWTGYGDGPHENAIMMFGAEGCGGSCALSRTNGDTNVYIYNNYFLQTLGHPGGTTSIWLQDGTSADIYNNVFNRISANNDISVTEPVTNIAFHVGIYNNTFYGGNPHINVGGTVAYNMGWLVVPGGQEVIVENNLLSSLNNGNNNYFDYLAQPTTNTLSRFTNNVFFDYNFYRSDQTLTGKGMVFGYWPQRPQYITTNSAPGTFGWENHSPQGNPLFIAANSTNVSTANILALQANSPAIGAGLNLTSLNLPGLNRDCVGIPRPATGNWTIGAYQGSAAVSLLPPTNVRVVGP